MTAKELERHISDSAVYHLNICENFIAKNHKKEETTTLHQHMEEKMDHICYVSGKFQTSVSYQDAL